MNTRVHIPMKSLAIALGGFIICQYFVSLARSQDTLPPSGLNIVIVEGEGAVNNSRQHVSREPIVRIEDDNHKPISGAAVVFTLPTEGTTGVFGNGSQTLIVNTNSSGLAVGKGLKVNSVSGNLPIHVSASFRGLTAGATVNETNEGVPGAKASTGGGHTKLIVVLAIVGAAAAGGGAYFATHKNSSSSSTTTTTSTSTAIGITNGTTVIIGPP